MSSNKDFTPTQPPPIKNEKQEIWPLVIKDMEERHEFGKKKYGTGLQPFNGRNSLLDVYEECLDLLVYFRQKLEEQKEIEDELEKISKGSSEDAYKVYQLLLKIKGGDKF